MPLSEEQVRQIIRQELQSLLGSDRYTFQKHLQLFNGRNIQLGKTTGTDIGTEGGATGQKLGFYGVTPIVQWATVADPAGGGAAGVDAPARTAIIAIIDALQLAGLMR